MLQIRFVPNLLVFGTAFLLLGLSLATNISPSYAATDTYVAPADSPSVRPLGEMRSAPANNQTLTQPSAASGVNEDATLTSAIQPVQSGNITYVTGGIGDEERNALQAVQKDYNVHVMSATRNGAFSGDTRIVILDHNSGELVNTESGPLFYAKLPDGHYTVQASHDGSTKEQKITVQHGKTSHVHFSW